MTTSEWLDRLTPKATAVLAVGTRATYGGIHAMAGNPTGATPQDARAPHRREKDLVSRP